MHFHGTTIKPKCRQDEIIHTLINSKKNFLYQLHIPNNEPPGLYWYHTHIDMFTEPVMLGGGTGPIIVQGIENLQPLVTNLTQHVLIVRDQAVAGSPPNVPLNWTLNNVPIAYPDYTPAIIKMQTGERQLWRVSNSSADNTLDLQLLYDGVPQTLEIVGLDGVPTGSDNGVHRGTVIDTTDILIPTAGRAEFIVPPLRGSVTNTELVSLAFDAGMSPFNLPQRTLATIKKMAVDSSQTNAPSGADRTSPVPTFSPVHGDRSSEKAPFGTLAEATVDTTRLLYFSETPPPPPPTLPTFYITVDGATPTPYDPNSPPAIVTTQGSVEDWTIENRSGEAHAFHLHQIHYLVLSQNNFEINGSEPLPYIQGQYLDTINVPFWDLNSSDPYPSVTLRMDFHGTDIGEFLYHCHIAQHEDNGMMAIIEVTSSPIAALFERFRLGFASLGWFRTSDAVAYPTWCVGGRAAYRAVWPRWKGGPRKASPPDSFWPQADALRAPLPLRNTSPRPTDKRRVGVDESRNDGDFSSEPGF